MRHISKKHSSTNLSFNLRRDRPHLSLSWAPKHWKLNLLLHELYCSSIFMFKPKLLKAVANLLLHLHFQTASHGRSCLPPHQSSTGYSHWGGSQGQWCSSGLEPAHWTPLCEGQFFWSRGGWRRWWKAWKNLETDKFNLLKGQKCKFLDTVNIT